MTKYSKVFGLDRVTGEIIWERSAIGFVSDFQVIRRPEQPNVALVINAMDVKKTRIAE
jgi:hypothetical protein